MTDWDKPTRAELAHEVWLEETCDECGEQRANCTCSPGCSCDGED